MYSTITCEYSLPFSGKLDMENPPDWSEFSFQTSSFCYEFGGNFTISEDGQLYKDTYRLVSIPEKERKEGGLPHDLPLLKEEEDGIEKMNYTGEIDFFSVLTREKLDYWIEFKALFWKGDLKEITLESLEKKDNFERVESQKKLIEEIKKFSTEGSSWWRKLYKKTVRVSFFLFKWFFAWGIRCLQRIEMWLLGVK